MRLTPIQAPDYVLIDRRDLNSIRERLAFLEDANRDIRNQLALMQQGIKERHDEQRRLLLAWTENAVAREKLG
jgi:hypothetical protein